MYPMAMITNGRRLHLLGLVAVTLGLTGCESCKDNKQKTQERCEDFLDTPSEDFPSYTENTDAGMPSIGFQVCDSQPADLNGDGLLDFVAANHIDPGFGYFMQETSGDPLAFGDGVAVPFSMGGNSAGIAIADFNADGIPDVANSDHPGTVTVRINATPPGAATSEVVFPSGGETTVDLGVDEGEHGYGFAGVEGGLAVADFNADGKPDIATANLGTNAANEATSSVLINTTPDPADDGMGGLVYADAATFAAVQYVELPGPAISIASADFNADGLADYATSNTAVSSVSIFTNQTMAGTNTVEFVRLDLDIPAEDNDAGAGPTNPVAADFNNDGKPDLATANWNVDTVTLFTNTTEAGAETSFTSEPFVVELCFNPLVVRAGDLDGDGDNDLAIVPLDLSSSIAVGVIENKLAAGSDIPDLALVDIVYLPDRMKEVTFFEWLDGKGDGDSPGIWFTSTGNVADFDGDGAMDIAVAVAYGNFAIEMQSHLASTDDILEFVEPPVDLTIANTFLPDHTELIHFVPQ
jgi:hypothetical protein